VVEDVVGPTESGTGWAVAVRAGDELWVIPESDLEPLSPAREQQPERLDTLRLRLVTDLTDTTEAARVAELIEVEVRAIVGPAAIEVEAERHWAEPYFYELEVSIVPVGDAVAALRAVAVAGGDGWLSCRDDGWRCDLWWSADDDADGFLVPEVRGAELALLPWSSPKLRPEAERPLVSV
jgi:hypothetical protein